MADRHEARPSVEELRLRREDLRRIGEYGAEHTAEYGGHWFEDHQQAYGVAFTASLREHEAALRGSLRFPERLRVRQCTNTHAYLRHMQEVVFWGENEQKPDGAIGAGAVHAVAVDVKRNVLVVQVLPGFLEVEKNLKRRYGSLVTVVRSGMAKPLNVDPPKNGAN